MITLIVGDPQNCSALIVPNGSVAFQLNVDGMVIAAPHGFVSSEVPVTFQFDANGNIQPNAPAAAAQIYSNAELNPRNATGLATYYLVTFYDANGARISEGQMWWQFPEGAGSTVDVGNMVPVLTEGNVIFYPTDFGAVPGGFDQSIQFNRNGAFGGDSALKYDYNAQTLSVGGATLFQSSVSLGATLLDGTGSAGTSGQVLSSTGTATKWITQSGGGGSPAGSDTQIQFNQSGSFGADANLTWDYTDQILTVGSQTDQFFFAGVLEGLWSFGLDDVTGGNSVVAIVDRAESAAALQCLSSGSSAQIRAIGSVPAVLLTDGTSTFTAEATTYENLRMERISSPASSTTARLRLPHNLKRATPAWNSEHRATKVLSRSVRQAVRPSRFLQPSSRRSRW